MTVCQDSVAPKPYIVLYSGTGWHCGCWYRTFSGSVVRPPTTEDWMCSTCCVKAEKGGTERPCLVINLSQCHCVHHTSSMDCSGSELGPRHEKPATNHLTYDTTTFILVDFKVEGCCCVKAYRRIADVRSVKFSIPELTALNFEFFWLSTECMNMYVHLLVYRTNF